MYANYAKIQQNMCSYMHLCNSKKKCQNVLLKYAKKYAKICKNVQKEICRNMQKYTIENMQEICKNMQKICNNMHSLDLAVMVA